MLPTALFTLLLSFPIHSFASSSPSSFGIVENADLLGSIRSSTSDLVDEEDFDFEFERDDFEAPDSALLKRAGSGPQRDFQVQQPPVVPSGKRCVHTLIEYDFANSYGNPAILDYVPPKDCGKVGSWASVVLNLTVSVNGTQYDRLGLIYLDSVEIWRTSTSEPTTSGVYWNTYKDVSKFIPLFSKPGTLLFDEGNIYNDQYTGIYHTTLTATFYEPTYEFPQPLLADLILPLSTGSTTGGAVFSTPPSGSTNITIPPNTITMYAEILASGNSNEEFWYMNSPNEVLDYYPPGYLTQAQSPYREVQLLVDGRLAGVAYPWPVIYTGGVILSWWRPMASYGAYDAPSYLVDLTPFVPLLTDSKSHNFTLNVVGQGPDFTTEQNWFVDGALYVQTGNNKRRTTGKITSYKVPQYIDPKIAVGSNADNSTVWGTTEAERFIEIEAELIAGDGEKVEVVWRQDLSFKNKQVYKNTAYYENVVQTSEGTSTSTHNGKVTLSDTFSFPISIWSNYTGTPTSSGLYELPGAVNHSYVRTLLPPPILAGGMKTEIDTTQSATGSLFVDSGGVIRKATGNNEEKFSYIDGKGNTYHRDVVVQNNTVVSDHQAGSLAHYGEVIQQRSFGAVPAEGVFGGIEFTGKRSGLRVKRNRGGLSLVTSPVGEGMVNKFPGVLAKLDDGNK